MTYPRVIPRDLFNEGNLLTCLGRLWIKLDDRRDHRATLRHVINQFHVEQDPADGSISCPSVRLDIHGHDEFQRPHLFRPLNAREKWPLWARIDDEDVRVFDLDGELSPEFWIAITEAPHVA